MTAPTDRDADAGASSDAGSVAPARERRLAVAVAAIRSRGGRIPFQRYVQVAGAVLVPLGVVLIYLSWYGASHTSRIYLQIPYLISGGLLGVGAIVSGGFFYFGHWLTHLVQDGRRQAAAAHATAERTAAALERIETLLRAQANGSASPASPAPAATEAARLVATPKGKLAHRPDCPLVAGRDDLRALNGRASGYEPCKACQPALSAR